MIPRAWPGRKHTLRAFMPGEEKTEIQPIGHRDKLLVEPMSIWGEAKDSNQTRIELCSQSTMTRQTWSAVYAK